MGDLAHLAAVLLALLGLIVLFTDGSAPAALGLIVLFVTIALWQRSRNQRIEGRRP